MSVLSIKINNLLSFQELDLKNINDINCFVGTNNAGKSNLFKIIKYFYSQIEGERILSPTLNSNYSPYGEIEIEFDLSRIRKIVTASRSNAQQSPFFKHIYSTMFNKEADMFGFLFNEKRPKDKADLGEKFKLGLIVNKDGTSFWKNGNPQIRSLISYLFPFFAIDARHINLHEWDDLWNLIARIKSFKVNEITSEDVSSYVDEQISPGQGEFLSLIDIINTKNNIIDYSHKEKIISLVKASLPGDQFYSSGEFAEKQSDGTNSFNFIDSALTLLIWITRREYISPIIFIDEPEVGLHPKRCEYLVNRIYDNFHESSISASGRKVNTPFPKIFITTHSPNIVKEVIRKFDKKQNIYHVAMLGSGVREGTKITELNSKYDDIRFLNKFSDNEARLFFSQHILFVEGATERELLSNVKLSNLYPNLTYSDVYAGGSDNVLSEAINPGKTNASIPYLFIYDVDKAFEFIATNNPNELEVKFKDSISLIGLSENSLKEERKQLNLGYSKSHKKRREQVEKLLSFQKRKLTLDHNRSTFKELSAYQTMRSITQEYLKTKNVVLLDSTVEGLLISKASKVLFYKWLYKEKNVDIFKLEYRIKNKNLYQDKTLAKLDEDSLFQCVSQIYHVKCNSQIKINKNNQLAKIKTFIENQTGIKPPTKTSGWVTSFLDYAIEDLDSKLVDKSLLRREFSLHFPKLHDILTSVEIR